MAGLEQDQHQQTVSQSFLEYVRTLCLPSSAPWHTDREVGGGMHSCDGDERRLSYPKSGKTRRRSHGGEARDMSLVDLSLMNDGTFSHVV